MGREKKKNYNLGLSLLKMLMCFEVVLCHFWRTDECSLWLMPFWFLQSCAVPVFMIISFYFTQKSFFNCDKTYIKKRVWRLAWPQIGWAIIYYVVYVSVEMVLHIDTVDGIGDLFWQMFTGHSRNLNASMWYQTSLIILTVLFFWVCRGRSEQAARDNLNLYLLCSVSLAIQYSEINTTILGGLPFELKYPLGRICEMIPLAVLGFVLADHGFYKKIKRYRYPVWPVIAACLVIAVLCQKYAFLLMPEGFGYCGIPNIISGFCLVTAAVLLPLKNIPEFAKTIIEFVSRYTLGIYCMHRLVATLLFGILERMGIQTGTFALCIVVYILCYLASWILYKIPLKLSKQLVA